MFHPFWLPCNRKRKCFKTLAVIESEWFTLKFDNIDYSFFFSGDKGCSYCGGLGHRITQCPKLEAESNKQVSAVGRKDYLSYSAADY